MKRIQAVKPDVSQTYLVDSDTRNTRKNPIVYKTVGKPRIQTEHPSDSVDVDNVGNLDDDQDVLDLPPAPIQVFTARSETNRLCDKQCFVCKNKVGSVHSKRIGN